MRKKTRAQIGIEYMIIVSFVTFSVMVIFALAIFYSGQTKDQIRLNQIENFAVQVVNSAESVFFAGEPSKTTITLSLPDGVSNIQVVSDGIIFRVSTSSGENTRLFESTVPLSGSIDINEGTKEITLTATDEYVIID